VADGPSADEPSPAWLSDEWFDLVRGICAEGVELNGLSGRVQYEITGGPRGGVSCHWVMKEGQLESGGPGRIDDADVTLTAPWDDAVAVQRGELDPNVAFMQGRLKVTGSMGIMTVLLSRARTPDCVALRERISAVSRF
jgi:SCP-2 sterol transfer family